MEKQYQLIIFDVDRTLVTTKSGKTFRESAADWQFLPGRREKLQELRRAGVRVAVATNRGGVAFGFLSQKDMFNELSRMMCELSIPAGGLYVCYTHPQAKLEQFRFEDIRRKPGPGMLQEAMQDFETSSATTLMVGDRPEDEQAARAAGCDFMWADEFFTQES